MRPNLVSTNSIAARYCHGTPNRACAARKSPSRMPGGGGWAIRQGGKCISGVVIRDSPALAARSVRSVTAARGESSASVARRRLGRSLASTPVESSSAMPAPASFPGELPGSSITACARSICFAKAAGSAGGGATGWPVCACAAPPPMAKAITTSATAIQARSLASGLDSIWHQKLTVEARQQSPP